MKRKRFSEQQIIGVLKEAEQTGNIWDVCWAHSITETTFYRWRSKFGGMEISEAKRFERLEAAYYVSERRACQVVRSARNTKRRPSGRIEEAKLVRRVHELSDEYHPVRLPEDQCNPQSRGAPRIIKSDNGPELVAGHVQDWIEDHGIDTKYIDPGSPWQNNPNESFNGMFRDGCLDH